MKPKDLRFAACFRYDLALGLRKTLPLLALPFLAGLADCIFLCKVWEGAALRPTAGNLLFAMYRGAEPYDPGSGLPFLPPIDWMAAVLACLIPALQYPFFDCKTNGINVFSRCRNRTAWWDSKAAFVLLLTLLGYVLQIAAACLFSLFSGGVSFAVEDACLAYYGLQIHDAARCVFLFVPLSLLALSLLQSVISLFFSPVAALLVTVAHLFLASYLPVSVLPACFAMTCRYTLGASAPRAPVPGAAGGLVFLLAAVVTAALGGLWSRRDVL